LSKSDALFLLADDSSDDARILRMALDRVGAEALLESVKNGEALLKRLEQPPRPALILLDINLPMLSGLEALQRLKAEPKWRSIPTIIWTTSRNPEDVNKAYALGAASYFAKPDSFDELVEMLRIVTQYWLQHVVLPSA
jgi:CheY-like chemotaxis protein